MDAHFKQTSTFYRQITKNNVTEYRLRFEMQLTELEKVFFIGAYGDSSAQLLY